MNMFNYRKTFSIATRRRLRHVVPLGIAGAYVVYCVKDRFEFHYEKKAEILEAKAIAEKEKEKALETAATAAAAAAMSAERAAKV